ncbi:Rha family transcriptional regulator [Saccharibacter floricola]|uniref:Phage regulatory protein n=1 Tax=Saccharibacter floricola DSM 15669 TaxID=1123227 RepID=A0ABQ0P334_9PROT|nr:phage regulatory protein/antirepressor Ant [Saccharibacter floricola]GBQ07508.1 phage regulatory protein [Saccharibacter floricola DSM 15669]
MSALLNTPLTMSSREIAELTGKQHKNVIRDIEKMLEGLEIARLNFEHSYIGEDNTKRKCYNLNKELIYTLMAGYNVKLRNAIIKRWMELEESPQLRVPQTLPEALRLAAEQAEEIEQQKAQISSMQDDVSAFDRIAKAEGALNITKAAKALQIKRKDLFEYLHRHKWIYRRNGDSEWLGYASRTQTGDLTHKVTTILQPDGEERVCQRVLVTPQGISKLAKLLPPRLQAVA